MLAPLGSVVVYMGKKWINACRNYQPVWGVKRGETTNSTDSKKTSNKSFAEVLKDAQNGKIEIQEASASTNSQNNQTEADNNSINFYI